MSIYPILPHPTYDENDFATWEGGFTPSECDAIIRLGEEQTLINSTVGAGLVDPSKENIAIRKSKNGWIELNDRSKWVYDRIANISRCLNGLNWRFEISGFNEHLQYTRYDAADKDFYGWHTDGSVKGDGPPRKLSLTIQLSDPNDYEGGDFQLHGTKLSTVAKERGLTVCFPSYTLHQVTPVTKGVRKSLVVWLVGPPFK
tara:strand:+ start:4949 stop:5551 length:603 start_codon:yes stop_codon:yes gene_type:complete